MNTIEEKKEAFERLLNIMDELRVKCPWDKKQTFESLRTNTIEETYELADAIFKQDYKNIQKELGDVLLHIVFYSKIASELQLFDIKDVCDSLCDKLIVRHPHVYGTTSVENSTEVETKWEDLKLKEKDGNKGTLSGVPDSLPALIKANRIQEKARNVGFDWEDRKDVWNKVKEEISEFENEIENDNSKDMEAEFGDLMFSLINAARLYKINPENALERTNQKFIKRFNYVESKAKEQGKTLREMTLAEMDELWNEAKNANHT